MLCGVAGVAVDKNLYRIERDSSRAKQMRRKGEGERGRDRGGARRTDGAVSLCGGSMYSASVKDKG